MSRQKKELKKGWTTGTCAQAASRAAAEYLLTGRKREQIKVWIPAGWSLELPVEECRPVRYDDRGNVNSVRCGIRKYSGDDPDITNGVVIYSTVSMEEGDHITIDGGEGVGRVTKPGLDQPVGSAAINTVPRKMIEKEVREVRDISGYTGGLKVIIEIPGGQELAEKTFNPRIGIEGGLSVLGTSGIVEPMSEQALIDTIEVEIKVKLAAKREIILAAPGNYGLDFLEEKWQIQKEEAVKCSNYVGETIDMAVDMGVRGILFVSHIGKFVKVAAGIMNTHSHSADGRMEVLAAGAIRAGADLGCAKEILNCNTTDEALAVLDRHRILKETMKEITDRIQFYLDHRSYDQILLGAVIFSSEYGYLGQTEHAAELIKKISKGENR